MRHVPTINTVNHQLSTIKCQTSTINTHNKCYLTKNWKVIIDMIVHDVK